MKKVGILTFHRSFNYGAFMQAYSLSTRLAKLGCAVELINYDTPQVEEFYRKSLLCSLRTPLVAWKTLRRNQAFRRALPALPLSGPALVTADYQALFAATAGKYDLVVVGSDAVWNWNVRGFPNAYLLGGELGCPKMSYAASAHGLDFGAVTPEQRAYLRETMQGFSFIGVRDQATAAFVQGLDASLPVHRTCDPTLFLEMQPDTSALRARLAAAYRMRFTRPLIGLMSANKDLGRRVREQYGHAYDIVSVYVNNPYADYFLYDLSPFEWAQVFSLFKLTVTQFFHGTLLSLKNGTPVVSIDYWPYSARYTGKMQDVLTWLGLEDCFFFAPALDAAGWEAVWTKAARQLAEPPTAQIQQAITRVAVSYLPFEAHLRGLLELPARDTTAVAAGGSAV